MRYTYKDGKIYDGDNELYSVNIDSTAGSKSIEIKGYSQTILINKAPGGYKIFQGDMDMGTLNRNLTMNYNGRAYSVSKPYINDNVRTIDMNSDTSKVGTMVFNQDSLTGTFEYLNDEVPAVIYMSLLSPYIKNGYVNPSNSTMPNRGNRYAMSKKYLILSNVVFFVAIILIFASGYLGIPGTYDFVILILAVVFSYVVRIYGRRKYMEEHQNDINNQNNNQ